MKGNTGTSAMVQIAMLAAVTAVLSQLVLPMPTGVPLTLQTFAVAFCGYAGGMKRGVTAVLLYLGIGAVGVPVFSGFRGGISVLLGYTGGFLWGFLPMVLLCGAAMYIGHAGKLWNTAVCILMGMLGVLVCHGCGVLQYAVLGKLGLAESALLVSLPYLLKDMLLTAAAYGIASGVKRALKAAGADMQ